MTFVLPRHRAKGAYVCHGGRLRARAEQLPHHRHVPTVCGKEQGAAAALRRACVGPRAEGNRISQSHSALQPPCDRLHCYARVGQRH